MLPRDDKKARELLLNRAQYHMEGSVLYYVEADKTLRLIPPTGYRKHLFEEAHCGKFGAHLGVPRYMANCQNITGGLG